MTEHTAIAAIVFLAVAAALALAGLLWLILHDGKKLTVNRRRLWQDYDRGRGEDPWPPMPGRGEGA